TNQIDTIMFELDNNDYIIYNLQSKTVNSSFNLELDCKPQSVILLNGDLPYAIFASKNFCSIFDIDKCNIKSKFEAHYDDILKLVSIPARSEFITIGNDNSIKIWTFSDTAMSSPRVLHERNSLKDMPLCLEFYGSDSNYIVAGDSDSKLMLLSTRHESLNKTLGSAYYKINSEKNSNGPRSRHLPQIVDLST
ncbi:MAG: WD repeat-containing protein 36, partial [Paramarteilia canceri]